MDAASRPASEIDFHRLAARLKLATDPIRVRVLLLLGDGERAVGAPESEIACRRTVVSQHLALLRAAGIIEARRDRQRRVYSLTPEGRDLLRVVEVLVGRR